MSRPRGWRPSSRSRSAPPSIASNRRVIRSSWWKAATTSPARSPTATMSWRRGRWSIRSPTRTSKPTWASCTVIWASSALSPSRLSGRDHNAGRRASPRSSLEEAMKLKTLLLATVLTGLAAGAAQAQVSVKLGVLNDMSGLYSDISGPGSVVAAKMAVEDFKAAQKGIKAEVISADHQNKPDVGSSIARKWYDQDGVDAIFDVTTSSVALAVSEVTREKNKVFMVSGGGTSDLTGEKCSPNTVHWAYDTWALANGTGTALTKRGGDTWFFLTADYAFGSALERDATQAVKKAGGKVLGSVRHPLSASDFSSFLLQAQASKAKVIGLANAGGDTINSIKQASEFGIVEGGQKLAGLLVFISDIHSLGLQATHGLQLTSAFYWDQNDETRAWSKRFTDKMKREPTMVQAGVYGAIMHYL